ncbi:MAG: helix-turn-helix domain-containing protein [Victivallales bacterium]|nr:helix-turn-helix domain-containing protein [Victivallales bacterium]
MKSDNLDSRAPGLERGLMLLELVANSPERGIGFNDLVVLCGVPTASAARFLRVLVDRGYLAKDPGTGLYRLGATPVRLVERGTRESRLLASAGNVLRDLRDHAGHTATFFIWEGDRIRCAAKCPHENSLAMQELGAVRRDILAFPWGWIFADSLPKERVELLIRDLPTREMSIERYQNGLTAYRRNGFAYDENPVHSWMRFGAPVWDEDGNIVAAVALGVPRCPLPAEEVKRLGELVKKAANKLSGKR